MTKPTWATLATIPNILSTSRIIASPPLFWSVMQNNYNVALGILGWCAVSDYLDGQIARRYAKTQQSPIGPMIDPIGDKLCITALTGALLVKGALPLYLGSLIMGRDFLLLGGSAISRFVLKKKEKIKVTMLSKINTAFQMSLLGYILWNERKRAVEEQVEQVELKQEKEKDDSNNNNYCKEENNTKENKSLLLVGQGIVACSTTLSALEYLLIFLKKMR